MNKIIVPFLILMLFGVVATAQLVSKQEVILTEDFKKLINEGDSENKKYAKLLKSDEVKMNINYSCYRSEKFEVSEPVEVSYKFRHFDNATRKSLLIQGNKQVFVEMDLESLKYCSRDEIKKNYESIQDNCNYVKVSCR